MFSNQKTIRLIYLLWKSYRKKHLRGFFSSIFREYLESTSTTTIIVKNNREEEGKNIGSLISPRFSHFYDFMMRTRRTTLRSIREYGIVYGLGMIWNGTFIYIAVRIVYLFISPIFSFSFYGIDKLRTPIGSRAKLFVFSHTHTDTHGEFGWAGSHRRSLLYDASNSVIIRWTSRRGLQSVTRPRTGRAPSRCLIMMNSWKFPPR